MENLIVYSGRFQPFGPHHFMAYQHLVEKFKDVYITTSGKIQYPNSPFSYDEKFWIITKMFNINKIYHCARPYHADAHKSKEMQEQTAFITGLSKKDADRLSHSKYFSEYSDDIDLKPMAIAGYYYILPEFQFEGEEISGTALRRGFAFERFKKKLFKKVYGKFDEDIFKLITSRLSFMELLREEYING